MHAGGDIMLCRAPAARVDSDRRRDVLARDTDDPAKSSLTNFQHDWIGHRDTKSTEMNTENFVFFSVLSVPLWHIISSRLTNPPRCRPCKTRAAASPVRRDAFALPLH